jgi:hypothetical protein
MAETADSEDADAGAGCGVGGYGVVDLAQGVCVREKIAKGGWEGGCTVAPAHWRGAACSEARLSGMRWRKVSLPMSIDRYLWSVW